MSPVPKNPTRKINQTWKFLEFFDILDIFSVQQPSQEKIKNNCFELCYIQFTNFFSVALTFLRHLERGIPIFCVRKLCKTSNFLQCIIEKGRFESGYVCACFVQHVASVLKIFVFIF